MRYYVTSELEIVHLQDLRLDATVIAEVVKEGDDPLCRLRNPFAKPTDFWWPDNMFGGEPIRFSKLREMSKV